MKEVRDIKLDLLFGNDNEIINLFNEITDGIEIVNTNVYNEDGLEFIYHKDGEWIFFQDVKNGKFWCSNARYWTLFTSKFDLSYEEIQSITKFLVEEALKREVSTPKNAVYSKRKKVVQEVLKKELSTPTYANPYSDGTVNVDLEEALKREVTPIGNFYIEPNLVQEVLKKEVSTPHVHWLKTQLTVEEALKKEVNTPQSLKGFVASMVDEALKRDMTTPIDYRPRGGISVEVLKRELSTKSITYVYKKTHIEEALIDLKQELIEKGLL